MSRTRSLYSLASVQSPRALISAWVQCWHERQSSSVALRAAFVPALAMRTRRAAMAFAWTSCPTQRPTIVGCVMAAGKERRSRQPRRN